MLDQTQHFLNRELSWLKFNERVLNEAVDIDKPLLERLKFIAIASSNLDEFFMIRVAGLKQQAESNAEYRDAAGLDPRQQLELIDGRVRRLVRKQYRIVGQLLPLLTQEGLRFAKVEELTAVGRQWVDKYFYDTIYPVLTPLAINASHPFPLLANRSLNLAVLLGEEEDDSNVAVIPVPGMLPRLIEVPGQGEGRTLVLLEDVITSYCFYLFCGYYVQEVVPFRITRNADLLIDGDGAEDLLAEVEKSLRKRKRGDAVRLEIGRTRRGFLREFLLSMFKMAAQDVYEINGIMDLTCLMKAAALPGFSRLCHTPFTPQIPLAVQEAEDLLELIRRQDILLHHPYESFTTVVKFMQQAAEDPRVVAIKQTLYRVSGNSTIVEALIAAAERGKQVTVAVEVRARFDEENNILWARRLEEAGCHVIYGLPNLKVHGKIALVIRREEDGIRRYIHMGTGNYNDNTARLYSDISLFTADRQMGADASEFFNMLLGYSKPLSWEKLIVAPTLLRDYLLGLIDREIAWAEAGRGGHIIAKMNSLLDKEMILKLYEASGKGVKIELIVRGICSLIPGLPGVSENITVRSIVGRFLEHHRILYCANGGTEEVYLSSADWMKRNLSERVELLFPVERAEHISYVKRILDIALRDNCKAYLMCKDGSYRRAGRRGPRLSSQEELYREAKIRAGSIAFSS